MARYQFLNPSTVIVLCDEDNVILLPNVLRDSGPFTLGAIFWFVDNFGLASGENTITAVGPIDERSQSTPISTPFGTIAFLWTENTFIQVFPGPGVALNFPVRIARTTPIIFLPTDFAVTVKLTTPAASQVILPAVPAPNQWYRLKDGNGDFANHPCTVMGNGNNIDGLLTFPISAIPFVGVDFMFDGEEWGVY